jgi:hypothetical protein
MMKHIHRVLTVWAPALALVAAPAAASAAADEVAPAIVRKPAAKPAAQATSPAPPKDETACGTPGAAPCAETPTEANPPAPATPPTAGGTARTASPQHYYSALAASQGSGADATLDQGLMTAMSRLLAAGRCADAARLATSSDRAKLAARAQQLCQGN